jgi:hypothetical protein
MTPVAKCRGKCRENPGSEEFGAAVVFSAFHAIFIDEFIDDFVARFFPEKLVVFQRVEGFGGEGRGGFSRGVKVFTGGIFRGIQNGGLVHACLDARCVPSWFRFLEIGAAAVFRRFSTCAAGGIGAGIQCTLLVRPRAMLVIMVRGSVAVFL